MTHTPGPWHIGMRPGPMIYGTKGEQVSDMRETLLKTDEHRANARLIAAAPDLLAALNKALVYLDNSDSPGGCDGKQMECTHCATIRQAHAAIAKAESKK